MSLMAYHMLEVKNHLKVVLEEQGCDDLDSSVWRMRESFTTLCKIISDDDYATLSCVVPA